MNLFTRCPACRTVFRVTTRELQASSGRVRCGNCQEVFDAFASLSAQEPAAEQVAPARDAPAGMAARPAVSPPSAPARVSERPAPAPRPDPAASLYEWEFRAPPQRRHSALWASAALLLACAAIVQAAIAFRDELLDAVPATLMAYERACEWIGCELPLPRLAERLHVESSDLRVVNNALPNQIELIVLLRNRARLAVEYPAFELALTDGSSRVLGRRVFLPQEYLPADAAIGAGLPANAEVPIRLYLDTGSILASGYRVYFFYP